MPWIQACAFESPTQPVEAVARRRLVGNVGDLVARELDEQITRWCGDDDDGKDPLAELRGEQEFALAPFRGDPVGRDQCDDRGTSFAGLLQFLLPLLAWRKALR